MYKNEWQIGLRAGCLERHADELRVAREAEHQSGGEHWQVEQHCGEQLDVVEQRNGTMCRG